MENLPNSDLSFLMDLKNYSFDSKMMISQKYASRFMFPSEVKPNPSDVMPWELEVFVLFSVVYDDESVNTVITPDEFARIITKIRNYWHPELTLAEQNGVFADVYVMISGIQQFPVQGLILQKFFRYSYVFNFENESVSFRKEFKNCFNTSYLAFDASAFLTYLALCNVSQPSQDKKNVLTAAFSDQIFFQTLSINKENYINELHNLYNNSTIDYYYGLKMQYWWPIIEANDVCYIPLPYLIINACTETLLQRITDNNHHLRKLFGKEVIENYLFDIYSEVSGISWVCREFTYNVGHQEYRTSDVLAGEEDYCIFFETKALSPSLKLRKFDSKEIEKNIRLYSDAIEEVYKQIAHYMHGDFTLKGQYDKEKLFGVVVVWDDSNVSRRKVYEYTFAKYHLDIVEQKYVHSHIKIISLRSLEHLVLQNTSLLPALKDQLAHPAKWDYYSYDNATTENGIIPIYENYVADLKKRVATKVNGL